MRFVAGFLLLCTYVASSAFADSNCPLCPKWNAPQAPFKVYGNTYYVGVHGLSAVLISTTQGLILLDAGLAQSAPLIESNIRKLGFRVKDIKFILNSHAHFDHAGGIAGLQHASGAIVLASADGAKALRHGKLEPDDPQFGFGAGTGFPRVKKVRAFEDGETLKLGDVAITAHLTPGHTPGSTTWTWSSCENGHCLNVVYADSLNAISAPGFRFLGNDKRAGMSETFRHSIAVVHDLPCDVLLTVHPDISNTLEKLEQRQNGAAPDAFIDNGACRAYADKASRQLKERLEQEQTLGMNSAE